MYNSACFCTHQAGLLHCNPPSLATACNLFLLAGLRSQHSTALDDEVEAQLRDLSTKKVFHNLKLDRLLTVTEV